MSNFQPMDAQRQINQLWSQRLFLNFNLKLGGQNNPDIEVAKGTCLEITFDNTADIDHDFTVVDDSTSSELIHMDTPALTTTHHLWKIPDVDITLFYFCEVPGHRDAGMFGTFKIGAGSPVEINSGTNDNPFNQNSSSATATLGLALYSTIFSISFMIILVTKFRYD